jgi:metallo-beta-lactamase family protein
MAENGRIRHHLANNIENSNNTILIVSWAAPETLARRLADHDKVVHIFGENYPVKAEVVTINGFSAHADQNMLLRYANAGKETIKKIILVHGENRSAQPFKQKLFESGFKDVVYPILGEEIEI